MQIESGIPIPSPRRNYSGHVFRVLRVGESIVVSGVDEKDVARLRVAILKYSKKHGSKYVTRFLPEGLRIWRTV